MKRRTPRVAWYERALAIYEQALGPEHTYVATCLENYAVLLREMRRPKEAGELEARVSAIRAKNAWLEIGVLAASLQNFTVAYCTQCWRGS